MDELTLVSVQVAYLYFLQDDNGVSKEFLRVYTVPHPRAQARCFVAEIKTKYLRNPEGKNLTAVVGGYHERLTWDRLVLPRSWLKRCLKWWTINACDNKRTYFVSAL